MSQTRDILRHLSKGYTLTPLQALDRFACYRLAARIKEIREQGHSVAMRMVRTTNGAHIAQYSIEGARR